MGRHLLSNVLIDPRDEAGDLDVDGGASDNSARSSHVRYDSTEGSSLLKDGTARVSIACSDTSGQGSGAHVGRVQTLSELLDGVVARVEVDHGLLNLLQVSGGLWEESGGRVTPSSGACGSDGH